MAAGSNMFNLAAFLSWFGKDWDKCAYRLQYNNNNKKYIVNKNSLNLSVRAMGVQWGLEFVLAGGKEFTQTWNEKSLVV